MAEICIYRVGGEKERTKMSEDLHNEENCPFKIKFVQLEQDHNELMQHSQMSAVFGQGLLEETNILKNQIKNLQQCQEVHSCALLITKF